MASTGTSTSGPDTGPSHASSCRAVTAAEVASSDSFLFELVTAALYHRMRLSWFSGLHRLGMFVNILAGTAAVAAVVKQDQTLSLTVALVLAFVSAANLAFDFAGFARKHEDARRLYHDLAAELEESEPNEATIHRLRARMIRASASQPVVYEAAQALAYNAAIRSLGRDTREEFVLKSWPWLIRHIWAFNGKHFPKRWELESVAS
jgi:hypothetical protein